MTCVPTLLCSTWEISQLIWLMLAGSESKVESGPVWLDRGQFPSVKSNTEKWKWRQTDLKSVKAQKLQEQCLRKAHPVQGDESV